MGEGWKNGSRMGFYHVRKGNRGWERNGIRR